MKMWITNRLMLIILLSGCFAVNLSANTQRAATCNSSDVQAAINAAAEGDTVAIPSGTCTWTSGVTISGKGINVVGAGSGRIIAYSSTTLAIGTGSKTLTILGTGVTGSPATPAAPNITNGETLTISETGNRQNYMVGTVTTFSSGTGSLVVNITSTGGACGNSSSGTSTSNCKRWLISTIPQTTIINNSSSTLFSITEDSTTHTAISGIKIAHTSNGTGTGNGIDINAGGGQAILVHDCWIEQNSSDSIHMGVNRGVVWNCSFDSTPFSIAPLAVHMQPFDTTAWSTPSYFGALDTTGQKNFYVENSDFHAYLNSTDNDEGTRSVFRYSTFNNAGFGTHGVDTGPIGSRYFEYYNNVGNFNGYSDLSTFPMNWWFFVRGGTYVIYNNSLPPINSTDYPNKPDVNMIVMNLQRDAAPLPCWGAAPSTGGQYYFAPHQVGMGYVTGAGKTNYPPDGVTNSSTYSTGSLGYGNQYVGDLEPAYIWGNSRVPLGNISIADYGPGNTNSCTGSTYDTSANYIVENRNYFNGSTPKPGYTPYTYPHPARSGSTGGVAAPTNLAATVQ